MVDKLNLALLKATKTTKARVAARYRETQPCYYYPMLNLNRLLPLLGTEAFILQRLDENLKGFLIAYSNLKEAKRMALDLSPISP